MSTETDSGLQAGIKASRTRVPRSRGALSGIALIVLGAWAAIVPFIGPYLNFAFTPAQNTAWHWTADRGWLEVLPGAAAVLAGLILLLGANRVSMTFASWLGIAAGAWLIVGPVIAPRIPLNPGTPDPVSTPWVQTLAWLFFYYAVGAAILLFAAGALGRLSVQSVRDVRSAQRRVEAAAAARDEEERRRYAEDAAAERDTAAEHDQEPTQTAGPTYGATETREYPPA